jgi:hypothetical protein
MNSSEPWQLSEKQGLNKGEKEVCRILADRRRLFTEVARSIPASGWDMRSRCAAWSIHEVVRHVRDVTLISVARLEQKGHPFGTTQFDPRTSPAEWMRQSDGEKPQDTLDDLELLFLREEDLFARWADAGSPAVVSGPLRRKVHWSVVSIHILWDCWMHERDICIPLGISRAQSEDELRLMVMYSLMAASAPAAWTHDYVDVALGLAGSPDGTYEVSHSSDDVYVYAGGSAQLHGPMEAVVDSLAGRGPELGKVLGGSGDAVRKLALLRALTT